MWKGLGRRLIPVPRTTTGECEAAAAQAAAVEAAEAGSVAGGVVAAAAVAAAAALGAAAARLLHRSARGVNPQTPPSKKHTLGWRTREDCRVQATKGKREREEGREIETGRGGGRKGGRERNEERGREKEGERKKKKKRMNKGEIKT